MKSVAENWAEYADLLRLGGSEPTSREQLAFYTGSLTVLTDKKLGTSISTIETLALVQEIEEWLNENEHKF